MNNKGLKDVIWFIAILGSLVTELLIVRFFAGS